MIKIERNQLPISRQKLSTLFCFCFFFAHQRPPIIIMIYIAIITESKSFVL